MKFNGKKCLKITGIVVGVIIVLLIVLLLTLPFIIRNGIYHAGPLITGVPMEIKHEIGRASCRERVLPTV